MRNIETPLAATCLTRALDGISRAWTGCNALWRRSFSLWTWDSLHSSRFFDILLADQIGYAPLNEDHEVAYQHTPSHIRGHTRGHHPSDTAGDTRDAPTQFFR